VPKLDAPVLAVLARTRRPLTGRQVHQLAGAGSESGVRKVLARLAAQGLVHASEAGQAKLYVANREHVAWPAVDILCSLKSTLLDRLRDQIRSWAVPPRAAALFGSAARGDGGTSSDIDVLLVRPDEVDAADETWCRQVDVFRDRVEAWTGNHCQVYEVDSTGLREHAGHAEREEPIVAEWRRDAIPLFGEDLRAFSPYLRRKGSDEPSPHRPDAGM
jgi:predicted nucleotidyltransferase